MAHRKSFRKDSEELGTVTETNGIEWDGGRTSYFRHGGRSDIKSRRRRRSIRSWFITPNRPGDRK
jgi:hypothetical protein